MGAFAALAALAAGLAIRVGAARPLPALTR